MALYPYVAALAVNPLTLTKAAGAVGQVFAPEDTSFATPLEAKDPAGNTIVLTSNADGILPSFYVELPSVNWKSGSNIFPLVTSQPIPGPQGPPGPAGEGGTGGGGGITTIPAEYVTDTELAAYMVANLKRTGLISITRAADGSFIFSTSATANDSNANLRDRSTHTGVQPISSVSGLEAALTNTAQPAGIMVARVYNFSTSAYPERGILPTGALVTWFGPVEPQFGNGFAVSGDEWAPRDA